MTDQTHMDFSTATPPNAYSAPRKALWWLKKGNLELGPEWDKAHTICQDAEGDKIHDWIHGLCHLIEGDHGNAAYWFRSVGKSLDNGDVATLWEDMAVAVKV